MSSTNTYAYGDAHPVYEGVIEPLVPEEIARDFTNCESCHPRVLAMARTLVGLESVRPNIDGRDGVVRLLGQRVICSCL